jgi:hypothetical protein
LLAAIIEIAKVRLRLIVNYFVSADVSALSKTLTADFVAI